MHRLCRSFASLAALVLCAVAPVAAQQYSPWVHPTYQGGGFKSTLIVKPLQAVQASPLQVSASDTTKRFIDLWYKPGWTTSQGQYVRVVAETAKFNDPAGINRKVLGDSDGLACNLSMQSPNFVVAVFGTMWPLSTPVTVPNNAWSGGGYTVSWRISPVDSIIAIGQDACPS
jgi:hypothetical protein